jgi:hypothetical protein
VFYDENCGETARCASSYEHPALHACHIRRSRVICSALAAMDLWTREARALPSSVPVSVNCSELRGKGEPLSRKSTASNELARVFGLGYKTDSTLKLGS